MRPPFVVASTGRCGSTFIAAVLFRVGVLCGHEMYWPRGKGSNLTCDSTRFVVPELDTYEGTVFHQVREPLKTISSLASGKHNPRYALRAEMPSDRLAYSCQFWADYNNAIEKHAVLRWRVEDIDADLIVDVAGRMGVTVTTVEAVAALGTVDDFNAHKVEHYATWDEIPDGPWKDEAQELARRYGYAVEA